MNSHKQYPATITLGSAVNFVRGVRVAVLAQDTSLDMPLVRDNQSHRLGRSHFRIEVVIAAGDVVELGSAVAQDEFGRRRWLERLSITVAGSRGRRTDLRPATISFQKLCAKSTWHNEQVNGF